MLLLSAFNIVTIFFFSFFSSVNYIIKLVLYLLIIPSNTSSPTQSFNFSVTTSNEHSYHLCSDHLRNFVHAFFQISLRTIVFKMMLT